MAKATYGYKADEWNEMDATTDAINKAMEDGILKDYTGSYQTEKVQTGDHRHANEFVIVIRTPE